MKIDRNLLILQPVIYTYILRQAQRTMIYPDNFEQKIGFSDIRVLLKEKCLSTLGREMVDEMSFSDKFNTINTLLDQVVEFMKIIQEEDSFPDQYFFDTRDSLRKIRIEGTWMDEGELFDLRRSLQTINDIVRFLTANEEENRYPSLRELAGDIMTFPRIVADIDAILDKYGKIRDNASQELLRIRREMSSAMAGISKSLNNILRLAQADGVVDKDTAPTMRDGRLVIPVAPGLKRKIKGIVHDESASGKTVYIEPAEVVEANNRIRELENEERREIIRILTAFADSIRPVANEIIDSYRFLAKIDFIRAKAIFSLNNGGIKPQMENYCVLDWSMAIHPLLQIALAKQGKKVAEVQLQGESVAEDIKVGDSINLMTAVAY